MSIGGGGDQFHLPFLGSGRRKDQDLQLAARAQLNANLSAQIGAMQSQTDALAELAKQMREFNRARANVFPRVWRFDLAGTGPDGPHLFELPQEQVWEITSLLVWAQDSSGPKAPSCWLTGLVGLDPFPVESSALTAVPIAIGVPVLGHTQEITAYAKAGTAATTRHTFVVVYSPISA